MGDRALIQLHADKELSPVLYLHWSGFRVPELLDAWHAQMGDRINEVDMAFARLVGQACSMNGGASDALSVRVWPQTSLLSRNDTQGDAGCFVVDVNTHTVRHMTGYKPKLDQNTPWTWVLV